MALYMGLVNVARWEFKEWNSADENDNFIIHVLPFFYYHYYYCILITIFSQIKKILLNFIRC